MQIMVVLCHPSEASFNQALARKAREVLEGLGHSVWFHDLYAEGFDPVLPPGELERGASFDERVLAHARELQESDGLVIVHPDWWGQPPALLKGWIDRVLRPGIAYEFEGGDFERKRKVPLLAGKRAIVVCTTDEAEGASLSALRTLWVERVLGWCGMRAELVALPEVRSSAPAQRAQWMRALQEQLAALFAHEAARPQAHD